MSEKKRWGMSLNMRWAITALASVLAFFFSYMMAMYQHLPQRVASHFNAQGVADDWMTKDQYTLFNITIVCFVSFLFVAIALLIRKFPDRLINIPRKKYWLAPERRTSSLESVAGCLLWIAAATAAYLFVVIHFVDRINLGNAKNLGTEFWIALAVYLAIVFLLVLQLLIRFLSVDRTAVDH